MNLYNAYVTSLELALSRDIYSDVFVIKKTVSYLEKVIEDIYQGDQSIIERMDRLLEDYFESEIYVESVLNALFVKKELSQRYEMNVDRLKNLHKKIKSLLSNKKEAFWASDEELDIF